MMVGINELNKVTAVTQSVPRAVEMKGLKIVEVIGCSKHVASPKREVFQFAIFDYRLEIAYPVT
jgi:hypothetical protein